MHRQRRLPRAERAEIIATTVADAAAYTNKHPGFGYNGDPLHPVAGRYYGYLVRAGIY